MLVSPLSSSSCSQRRLTSSSTLQIYAGINGFAFVLGYFCVAERRPPLKLGETHYGKNWLPVGVWSDGAFWSLMGSIGVGVFGYLVRSFFSFPLLGQTWRIGALTLFRHPVLPAVSILLYHRFDNRALSRLQLAHARRSAHRWFHRQRIRSSAFLIPSLSSQ